MPDPASLGAEIWAARRDGGVVARDLSSSIGDRDDAYAVQMAAASASGLTRSGWKIAATSELAQRLLDVDGPALGPVFTDHIQDAPCQGTAIVAHGTAVECEIAFVMTRTPESPAREYVLACVDHALIAIEVVGCRFAGGFQGAGTAACIADFAFNAGLVCGARIDKWLALDLAKVAARTIVNGETQSEGTGAAVLGDPLNALCWATEESARLGMPLVAGDIISTGTMTGATPVAPGDQVVGDFGDLGTIEIRF